MQAPSASLSRWERGVENWAGNSATRPICPTACLTHAVIAEGLGLIVAPFIAWQLEDLAAFEFVTQLVLAGENEAIFGGEELLAFLERCISGRPRNSST